MTTKPNLSGSNLPVSRLVPNMVTLLGLCAGLSSIRFALAEKWELSVAFIVVAAIIDGMDGRLARLLKSTSTYGAHLDSLSDFICFGVAPALLLFLWKLQSIPLRGLGWGVVVIFVICLAIRLARFNTQMEEDNHEEVGDFFTGVPAPAGAMLALLPMTASFELALTFPPVVIAAYIMVIALLMASRIPTFSMKYMHIPREYAWLLLVAVGMFCAGLLMHPWFTIPFLSVCYIFSIPLSIAFFFTKKAKRG